jgi:selenocysteine lyase/cysteine desulfurase
VLSSGVLIAKKKLFTNEVPSNCGGDTVNYVTRTHTEYVRDIETREEGGTPNILGSIRCGLVFHLKQSVGSEFIESREDKLVDKFFQRFRNHKTLFILGSTTVPRLAIFSFLIYVESVDKYLHHNFICVLLNDLFGIQVRSGCSCAGPYVLVRIQIVKKKSWI